MRILLAIDGSEHSEAVVEEIARQHFPAASEVRVISAVELPYFPGEYAEIRGMGIQADITEAERERARSAVDKAAVQIRAGAEGCKLTVTTEVLSGSPKQVILEQSEAFGADLIVVGSRGRGNFERFLLGSVAQAVALHATCSVEIVRSPKAQTNNTSLMNAAAQTLMTIQRN